MVDTEEALDWGVEEETSVARAKRNRDGSDNGDDMPQPPATDVDDEISLGGSDDEADADALLQYQDGDSEPLIDRKKSRKSGPTKEDNARMKSSQSRRNSNNEAGTFTDSNSRTTPNSRTALPLPPGAGLPPKPVTSPRQRERERSGKEYLMSASSMATRDYDRDHNRDRENGQERESNRDLPRERDRHSKASPTSSRTRESSDPKSSRPLPKGWECRVSSSSGKSYFYFPASSQSSWVHPDDMLEEERVRQETISSSATSKSRKTAKGVEEVDRRATHSGKEESPSHSSNLNSENRGRMDGTASDKERPPTREEPRDGVSDTQRAEPVRRRELSGDRLPMPRNDSFRYNHSGSHNTDRYVPSDSDHNRGPQEDLSSRQRPRSPGRGRQETSARDRPSMLDSYRPSESDSRRDRERNERDDRATGAADRRGSFRDREAERRVAPPPHSVDREFDRDDRLGRDRRIEGLPRRNQSPQSPIRRRSPPPARELETPRYPANRRRSRSLPRDVSHLASATSPKYSDARRDLVVDLRQQQPLPRPPPDMSRSASRRSPNYDLIPDPKRQRILEYTSDSTGARRPANTSHEADEFGERSSARSQRAPLPPQTAVFRNESKLLNQQLPSPASDRRLPVDQRRMHNAPSGPRNPGPPHDNQNHPPYGLGQVPNSANRMSRSNMDIDTATSPRWRSNEMREDSHLRNRTSPSTELRPALDTPRGPRSSQQNQRPVPDSPSERLRGIARSRSPPERRLQEAVERSRAPLNPNTSPALVPGNGAPAAHLGSTTHATSPEAIYSGHMLPIPIQEVAERSRVSPNPSSNQIPPDGVSLAQLGHLGLIHERHDSIEHQTANDKPLQSIFMGPMPPPPSAMPPFPPNLSSENMQQQGTSPGSVNQQLRPPMELSPHPRPQEFAPHPRPQEFIPPPRQQEFMPHPRQQEFVPQQRSQEFAPPPRPRDFAPPPRSQELPGRNPNKQPIGAHRTWGFSNNMPPQNGLPMRPEGSPMSPNGPNNRPFNYGGHPQRPSEDRRDVRPPPINTVMSSQQYAGTPNGREQHPPKSNDDVHPLPNRPDTSAPHPDRQVFMEDRPPQNQNQNQNQNRGPAPKGAASLLNRLSQPQASPTLAERVDASPWNGDGMDVDNGDERKRSRGRAGHGRRIR